MIRSIELEPKLLDAYWHRHLLHLLQDNKKVHVSLLCLIIFLGHVSSTLTLPDL